MPMTHDSAARTIAASPLSRPKSRKLGEPQFSRVPDHAYCSPESDRLLVALFFLAIFLPLVAYLRGIESGQTLDENRHLAPKPKLVRGQIWKLPEQIDAYYRDWFGFRKRLIQWQNTARYLWLRSSNDDLLQGKQGWIFFARGGTIQNHMGLAPFSPSAVAAWQARLERRQQLLAARGIKYVFVVAPDKPSIYPEMLPASVQNNLGETRLDQLAAALHNSRSPATLLDLRGALIDAKRDGVVYFAQDTHWNGRGLYAAAREIARHAHELFPEVKLPPPLGVDYQLKTLEWGGGDWNLFGLPRENRKYPSELLVRITPMKAREVSVRAPAGITPIVEPWNQPRRFVRPDAARKVLVLHDSFMRTGMEDGEHRLLVDSFAESTFVGMKPSLADLARLVDHWHPDLVIEELVERGVEGEPLPEAMPPLPAP